MADKDIGDKQEEEKGPELFPASFSLLCIDANEALKFMPNYVIVIKSMM